MKSESKSREANNPFAQAIFDCRDILLPKGKGKGGQRRRTDLRNILFTLATQGDPNDHADNGLWWSLPRISNATGIGVKQLRGHLKWLESVGLIHQKPRLNSSSVRWLDRARLRAITQRQLDDRDGYLHKTTEALVEEHQTVPEFEPDDLEEVYFTPEHVQGISSEARSEALPEPRSEARAEALAEARAETQSEAESEAQPERRDEDQLPSQRDLGGSIRAPQPPPSPMRHEDGL